LACSPPVRVAQGLGAERIELSTPQLGGISATDVARSEFGWIPARSTFKRSLPRQMYGSLDKLKPPVVWWNLGELDSRD
jgi:hypothetical protein